MKHEIWVRADGLVLYLGNNPLMVLGLSLMGKRASYLCKGAYEYQLNPRYIHLLNTDAFKRAMDARRVAIVDWDAVCEAEQ